MRLRVAVLVAPLAAWSFQPSPPNTDRIAINDNGAAAGVLKDGVLTVRLDAREGEWRPDGEADPGVVVRAFGEQGKALSVPGPLIRVREGTEIRAFIRNAIPRGTLTVYGLSRRGTTAAPEGDTIQVPAGETREVRFAAGTPGTYFYRGTTDSQPNEGATHDAELSGAFIVDPRGSPTPNDRVFLMALWRGPLAPGAAPGAIPGRGVPVRFTINGRSWPHTERLSYRVGDTVRFRVINASIAVHPMHLHGFYFNVGSRGDASVDTIFDAVRSPRLVVTERLAVGRTFSMTWVAERPGNWLFHCHDNFHVLRNPPLDGTPLAPEHHVHPKNHALEMMGGLVMGIEVRGPADPVVVAQGSARRKLRLVARADTGGTTDEPAYGYELQDGTPTVRPMLPSPTILLKRGEPVSITVVNKLPEATAVHWHGIELESYYDGVADYSGIGKRLAPAIAPGDSFVAHFTPPRSGTFMYHPHADEVRQQQAGLAGPIVVVDSPASHDAARDLIFLITVPRKAVDASVVLLNGSSTPAPIELRAGERYRFRVINLHTFRPAMIARLMRDSTLLSWRFVAKDGMDLPPDQVTVRPAMQQMGNGEAFDFEVMVPRAGEHKFTVTSAVGQLLVQMTVHVR